MVLFWVFLAVCFWWMGSQFYGQLDGVYFNKPYIPCVDILNLKVEKPVYHIGETVKYHGCADRTRDYEVRTTWRILNATVITYPDKGIQAVSAGHFEGLVPVGDIPKYATPGTHHIEGTAEIFLHPSDENKPAKTIYIRFRSQDFQVVQ